VADFYGNYFIGHWPSDATITPVCRTVGTGRVVDEMILSFTHNVQMPTFLPDVAPTGRAVMLPVVVVLGFEGVTGAAQAQKVLDKDLPANTPLNADQKGPPA
jgi:carboxymethylenebutenolidase